MSKKNVKRCSVIAFALCAGGIAVPTHAQVEIDPEGSYASGPNMDRDLLPTPVREPKADRDNTSSAEQPTEDDESRVSLIAGIDFTNAYYSRGLRQEDRGLLWQPFATVGIDVIRTDDYTLTPYIGTWHSFHDRATGSGTDDGTLDKWYEADFYFGVNATKGAWTFGAQYGWFASPNDAFTTVEELQLSVSFDDTDHLGAWSMQPNITLIIETGDGTSDGFEKGGYLQLGVTPGFDLGTRADGEALVRIDLPVTVGLSAWDYYQTADDEDELFGFASIGVKFTYELPIDDKFGAWSVYASVTGALLGDMAADVNDDEDTVGILSAGVGVEF